MVLFRAHEKPGLSCVDSSTETRPIRARIPAPTLMTGVARCAAQADTDILGEAQGSLTRLTHIKQQARWGSCVMRLFLRSAA